MRLAYVALALTACGSPAAPAAPAIPAPLSLATAAFPLAPGRYTTASHRSFTCTVGVGSPWTGGGETGDGFSLNAGGAAMGVVSFGRGVTTVAALLRTFRTTPGLRKSADEVTKPVDGNDARHLTWTVTRPVTVRAGGTTFTFRTGERNHAIVVDAPGAPVLVLMAATDEAAFRTVYDAGHLVVFATAIGPL